ncbi:MAG: nucleoside deaminase, partial [Candidatus Margulisbacteria bacterium]|nr:nucleoside deaminase [Candidatus Margulisiibacteriota bacterium]
MREQDRAYMKLALEEASKAASLGEVPVGVVIVRDGTVIARAHNTKEHQKDVTGHAEIEAIKKAQTHLSDWRLSDCELYTTLEPCPMCAGAILHARIKRLAFGAKDPKWGAVGSVIDLLTEPLFNHKVGVTFLNMPECG